MVPRTRIMTTPEVNATCPRSPFARSGEAIDGATTARRWRIRSGDARAVAVGLGRSHISPIGTRSRRGWRTIGTTSRTGAATWTFRNVARAGVGSASTARPTMCRSRPTRPLLSTETCKLRPGHARVDLVRQKVGHQTPSRNIVGAWRSRSCIVRSSGAWKAEAATCMQTSREVWYTCSSDGRHEWDGSPETSIAIGRVAERPNASALKAVDP